MMSVVKLEIGPEMKTLVIIMNIATFGTFAQ